VFVPPAFLYYKCWMVGGGRCEQAISRILCLPGLAAAQVAIIYLGQQLPTASSNQPGGLQTSSLQGRCLGRRTIPPIWSCSRWGLPSRPVTRPLVSSYLTISPLPGCIGGAGRYVSVALSLRSPSLAVSQHPALRSSDFPRALPPAIACLTHTPMLD
jgi:hypothetical protein